MDRYTVKLYRDLMRAMDSYRRSLWAHPPASIATRLDREARRLDAKFPGFYDWWIKAGK
jgi:hypothetical protein